MNDVSESITFPHACLQALDDEDRATAKLYKQRAAQAADEALQQTVDAPDSARTRTS